MEEIRATVIIYKLEDCHWSIGRKGGEGEIERKEIGMNHDIRLQVIVPPFPTLLPNSSFEKLSNLSPFSGAVSCTNLGSNLNKVVSMQT